MAQQGDVEARPATASPASVPLATAPPATAQTTAPPATAQTATAARATRRFRAFSDLDLNGAVPSRVRPGIGEWGPTNLPSTRRKRWIRILTPIAFTLMLGVVVALAFYFGQFFY